MAFTFRKRLCPTCLGKIYRVGSGSPREVGLLPCTKDVFPVATCTQTTCIHPYPITSPVPQGSIPPLSPKGAPPALTQGDGLHALTLGISQDNPRMGLDRLSLASSPCFEFGFLTCLFAPVLLWACADGMGWDGRSWAGCYLSSCSCHHLSVLLFGCADELLLHNLAVPRSVSVWWLHTVDAGLENGRTAQK